MPDRLLRAHRLVVSPVHVSILKAVAEAEREYGSPDLRLEGGTALSAYYLMHRQSEDLVLFGEPGLLRVPHLGPAHDGARTAKRQSPVWSLIAVPPRPTRSDA